MTAPTPERRVGEAELAEIVAMEWDGLRPDELRRNLARDLLDERAANAALRVRVEKPETDLNGEPHVLDQHGIPWRERALVRGNILRYIAFAVTGDENGDAQSGVDSLKAANALLTAEVERLKWEAVVWKSSLECWGRHHPWCWMVTQAGVEGVYCNCGYREALTGKDRSHEVTPLSPHDAEQVRLFEERIRASITPETEEAARRFVAARDAFAASGDSLPTPAPEATE